MIRRVSEDRRYDLLLLDFGGVCLLNPVEMHADLEEKCGLAPGTFAWLGPLDPSTDELWRQMIAGELTEREYWTMRAAEVGRAAGRELSLRNYMELLYDPPSSGLIRPEATFVVRLARAAGFGVSVLTNDMRSFHGREWEHGIDFFRLVDHIVDCSDTNILKPDPRAFERAEQMTGVSLDRMLFVDDQPGNVEGGLAVGLDSMWFDIANAADAWSEVGSRLGLEV